MRTNCLLWAIALHRRRSRKGREGYLCWRWSRWALLPWLRFPHILYGEMVRSGHIRLVSYKPTAPKKKPVPPLLFTGSSKWGDFPDTTPGR
jgi:hypothetical protein